MFTGIIEEIGELKSIDRSSRSVKLTVKCKTVLEDVKIGDSIATDGVCLTVTSFNQNEFQADIMPETMSKSHFGQKRVGDKVNLERALRLGDRLGGHMVSGHIDGVGKIAAIQKDEIAYRVIIQCSDALLKYMIPKGSIAIDGISLTIVDVSSHQFEVSIIPQTQDDTTLLKKSIGDVVNLENDMMAKYVERITTFKGSNITMDFLDKHGFL